MDSTCSPTGIVGVAVVVATEATEHLRRDDVETRPFPSKIQIRLQMTVSPRIPLIVDFGRTRQLPDPDRFGPYY